NYATCSAYCHVERSRDISHFNRRFLNFVRVLCSQIRRPIRNTSRMKKKVTGKDLRKEAPRSPRIRIGGYAILGRTMDKCRALVAGDIGEYHFDCPLDNMLFGFKGVKGEDFKAQIEQGASDQEMIEWLNQSGEKRMPEEIKRWAE